MKRPLTRVVLAVCIPVGLLLSACGFGGFTHSNTTDVPAPADAAQPVPDAAPVKE